MGRKLITLIPLNPGKRIEVDRVSGNFIGGFTLEGVRLSQYGRELVTITRLQVSYHLWRLPPPNTRVELVELDRPRITGRRQNGGWDRFCGSAT